MSAENMIPLTDTTAARSEASRAEPAGESFADRFYERFSMRHIGPSDADVVSMLKELARNGSPFSSLDDFTRTALPESIQMKQAFRMQYNREPVPETQALSELRALAAKNKVYRSFIGCGYYGTHTPAVILRNILENPGWYTQYTPYQAEISQGRLEALLNFQTMVSDLTGLPIANASLLDEGTAAAEAMNVALSAFPDEKLADKTPIFAVSDAAHPQTKAVIQTRAEPLGVTIRFFDENLPALSSGEALIGVLVQYPDTVGEVKDPSALIKAAHDAGAIAVLGTDLLALTLLASPGELGADIAYGSAQRFGVPLGFGGPHAAFFAVRDDLKRLIPGRLIGVSKDNAGTPALRLALQTREQHIRREKATSNICTAQVLLAVMASMYAVYHGPKGLKRIAGRVHFFTRALAKALRGAGLDVPTKSFFDTLTVQFKTPEEFAGAIGRAEKAKINVRKLDERTLGISLDEQTTDEEVRALVKVLTGRDSHVSFDSVDGQEFASGLSRRSEFLTHAVFNRYHSETEFLRYLKKLEGRDLSLAQAMIPLGSCTMKLNATSEMLPVSWPEFNGIHPFAPIEQAKGYLQLFKELEQSLKEVTGFAAVSLQPNSGAQGEFAGLLTVRAYLKDQGQAHRDVCLIPRSAHGTNPASAAIAGFRIVVVDCDAQGNVDLGDLKKKVEEHKDSVGVLMITYPSTHGVYEGHIKKIAKIVHDAGGQVYMDGANLNALVGLCRPADIGADVCHINLHKTFCIPHGGGGPGMGPIGVKKHLAPFLPNHPLVDLKHEKGVGPVSAAPWGSASILVIPWVYMRAMGAAELRRATQVAILNANYLATRLHPHYPVLYRGEGGFVAHECILDLRGFKRFGIEVEDVAKRLMDYGFHAPTVSFPVAGTLMVEPTESESKEELDRFIEAMIQIREEIRQLEEGKIDRLNNPLKNAPHTALAVTASAWDRPYTREAAAFPSAAAREAKFWPAVGRVDNVYGDKNLVCTCLSIDAY